MKRAAILILLFISVVLSIVGLGVSNFGSWMIERAADLITYVKGIEP